MKEVEQLTDLHFRIRTGDANWKDCINWAIQRLRHDEEGDDLDIVMLAAATREDEVAPLVLQIVERYIAPGALENEVRAGKLIASWHLLYRDGRESAISLDPRFWRLYYDLDQPAWLAMLARNCEYATDIPAFQKPFDDEFEYIAGLWSASRSLIEFLSMYDRSVSASHDAV